MERSIRKNPQVSPPHFYGLIIFCQFQSNNEGCRRRSIHLQFSSIPFYSKYRTISPDLFYSVGIVLCQQKMFLMTQTFMMDIGGQGIYPENLGAVFCLMQK